jgi:GMP synthase-like glutamine amidotransferase
MTALNIYVGFAQPDEWPQWAGTYARHAARFEAASGGVPCLVVPFSLVTPDLMRRLDPGAVLLSGFARSFEEYEVASFRGVAEWLASADMPVLAICGSHQLLGYLYNDADRTLQSVDRLCDQPMRRLRQGEPVTNPDYHPDYFMERGFYSLSLTEAGVSDRLFAGLDDSPLVYESHYCEIKRLPDDFTLLASTAECWCQAMSHRNRPLYGVQFHPEDYSNRFPDGQALLRNFFRLGEKA